MIGMAARALRNTAPVSYARSAGHSLSLLSRGDKSSTQAMEAMGAVSTLFSIVERTSTATSAVEWGLWRKARSGKIEDRTEVTSHAALDLINAPNPFMTRQELFEIATQHVDLAGETSWVLSRVGASVPLEIWPVRPDRMEPVPSAKTFLRGWVYTGPDDEKVPLELNEVISIRRPNPLDPYRGMGPVQTLLVDLQATELAAEWNRNFFRNSAEPGGIIQIDRVLGDDEFDMHVQRWRSQHRGVAQAHRVALLEAGMTWVDRKYTNKDMQFAELRSVSREIIREAFGIHPHMLGLSEDVNRANAEAAEVVFARWLIKPRLDRFKGALNSDLLPMFGVDAAKNLEFDYVSPIPEDREADNAALLAKAQAAKTYIDAHFSGDSVKEALELPDALEWDKPEPPVIAPPGQPGAPGKPPAPAVDDRAATIIAARSRARLVAAAERITRAAAAKEPEPTPAELLADEIAELQAEFDAALAALLAVWVGVTAAQVTSLVDQIRTAVDQNDTVALSALTADSTGGAALLAQAMIDLANLGAASVVREAQAQGVPDAHPAAVDEDALTLTATASAALLAAGLAAAAGREALRLATPESTGDEIAREIQEFLDGLSDRALRDVLGGALTSAQNAGRFATFRELPPADYVATEENDANTCGPCSLIDGHTFDDLADAESHYPTGTYRDCLGRDRCRGTFIGVWV